MLEFILTKIAEFIFLLLLYYCVYGVMDRICTTIERINGIGVVYLDDLEGDDGEEEPKDD